MFKKDYLALFVVGILALLVVAAFERVPGYMDAEYYYAGGQRLAQGHGFTEIILWNYLDDPSGLPHPANSYWMPLASILAAAGMLLSGVQEFQTARIPFLLLAAVVPPLTAALAYQLNQKRSAAWLAGLLAAIPGFYLPFLASTDTFGIYMILGGLYFLLLVSGRVWQGWRAGLMFAALGAISGLMHLSRVEGILWLGITMLIAFLFPIERSEGGLFPLHLHFSLPRLVGALGGYLVVMGPWFLRNLQVFHTLLAPGGTRTLWLTEYNELFIYPVSVLTAQRWWSVGLAVLFQARLAALWKNLQSFLAVEGEIFLFPLILLGLWRLRRSPAVQVGSLAWVMLIAAMTLVFPFAGSRGGFYHSSAALQPLFWAAAPAGLESFVQWGHRWRNWHVRQASTVFGIGLVGLALFFSVIVAYQKMAGDRVWDYSARQYAAVEDALRALGAQPQDIVLVNNPPGYYVASGRQALSIPYGDPSTALEVARRYGARYLLLEFNQLLGEDDLYAEPGSRPGLEYVQTTFDMRIYRILDH